MAQSPGEWRFNQYCLLHLLVLNIDFIVSLNDNPFEYTVKQAKHLMERRRMLRSKCDYLCEIYVLTAWTLYGRDWLGLNHTRRPTDRMGYICDIEPPDLRDRGPTMLIDMDGQRGPVPQEPAAGVSRLLHVRGPGWDRSTKMRPVMLAICLGGVRNFASGKLLTYNIIAF